MRIKNTIKSNKGLTGIDIVTSLIIVIILSTAVIGMFYKLYSNICLIRLNAKALDYAVDLLEISDRVSYDEVTSEAIEMAVQYLEIPDNYDISLEVEKYSDLTYGKEDIIKILTLTIKYSFAGEEEEFVVKKLKIKEM